MTREIVLDTETTGLDPADGHRLVEIACIELVDLIPTGRTFHRYVNPEREIDPEAQRVHGLSQTFLADKPVFADTDVAAAMLEFTGEATVVAHNAAFDRQFINHELQRAGLAHLPETRWVDSLALARTKFPGMVNSLDALCRRFKISLAERDKHGALIDARLLAEVYLELCGGRERRLDLAVAAATSASRVGRADYGPRPRPLSPRLSATEAAAHVAFLATELKGGSLWSTLDAAG